MSRGFEPRFDGDVAHGELREDAFARVLLGGRELWEHKTDRLYRNTGNLAIEYETSQHPNGEGERHPTGISRCTAYWYIIEYLPEQRLILPTEYVKTVARRAIRDGRHKWIGDSNRFHNALPPINWFFERPAQLRIAA